MLAAMERLKVPRELASRYLNDGFSGGEKKRVEILQIAMLQPRIAILDETDSGLDIDALRIVADGVNELVERRDGRAGDHALPADPRTTSLRTTSTSSSAAGSSRAAARSWRTSSRPRATTPSSRRRSEVAA